MTMQEALVLAVQRHQAGDHAGAESLYRQILAQCPDNSDAWHLLGVLAYQAGRPSVSADLIGKAIAINPRTMEYHYNLGLALKAMGQSQPAIDAFRHAAALPAPNAYLLGRLAGSFCDLSQWDSALACAHQVLAQLPDDEPALEVCARVAFNRGDIRQAAEIYRRVVDLRPDYAVNRWNYGKCLLALGKFAEGWEEVEWRFSVPGTALDRGFEQPKWDGTNAAGQTLLIHAEGGFGDSLHYIRYLPAVHNRAKRILLECHAPLVRLFRHVEGIDQVIARGDPLPAFDVHITLPSLPRLRNAPQQHSLHRPLFDTPRRSRRSLVRARPPRRSAQCRPRLGRQPPAPTPRHALRFPGSIRPIGPRPRRPIL